MREDDKDLVLEEIMIEEAIILEVVTVVTDEIEVNNFNI